MQWPPTRPGRNGRKFHLLPAASNTSSVSIPRRLKSSASSLMSAMFTSRCVFSMTLAASATRMLEALWVPARTIDAIELVDELRDLGRRTRSHLLDGRQAMFLVARVDALGAVAGEEILVELETGLALENRNADLFGAARIHGGLVHHDVALLEHLADGLAGALERRQVGAVVPIDRRRDRDDEDAALAEILEAGGILELARCASAPRSSTRACCPCPSSARRCGPP